MQGKRTGSARERRVNRMRAKGLLGKYMGETCMREKSVGEMCMGGEKSVGEKNGG